MWVGWWAEPRCGCGRSKPLPWLQMRAGVSRVPLQMWHGQAHSWGRFGRGWGAHEAGMVVHRIAQWELQSDVAIVPSHHSLADLLHFGLQHVVLWVDSLCS